MRSRFTPILAGLITLAMVVFGQVCALSVLIAPAERGVVEASVATSVADDHASTCDPAECGGDGEDNDKGSGDAGCPSGAPSCCSTWGPPSDRLSLAPPSSVLISGAHVWLVADDLHAVEDRASEVALFELARPPSLPTDAFLASSLSRRGPPTLS